MGDGAVFASELSLHYIITDFISVSERGKAWSIHSSVGTHAKAEYLAEWNQMVCTWFNHWNNRGWGPRWFKVVLWAVIGGRASYFFNLLSAFHASIIVLPALGWAVQGRLEVWSTQNMTLSLFTSCSLVPSIEGAGEEIEMQCNCVVAGLTLKKAFKWVTGDSKSHRKGNQGEGEVVYYKPIIMAYLCCVPQHGWVRCSITSVSQLLFTMLPIFLSSQAQCTYCTYSIATSEDNTDQAWLFSVMEV